MHKICTLTPPNIAVYSAEAGWTAVVVLATALHNGTSEGELTQHRDRELSPSGTNSQGQFPPIPPQQINYGLKTCYVRVQLSFCPYKKIARRVAFAKLFQYR